MSQDYKINFTYKNPIDDILEQIRYSCDGKIDHELTLVAIRQKLAQNIRVIDSLLSEKKNIEEMGITDPHICVRLPIALGKKLQTNKTLIQENESNTQSDSDEDTDLEYEAREPPETNYQRLSYINNLSHINETFGIFSDSDESESSTSDEMIGSATCIHNMVNLFTQFISNDNNEYNDYSNNSDNCDYDSSSTDSSYSSEY